VSRGGAPGEWVEWEALLDVTAPPYTEENGFSALGSISFLDFPERGRKEFEALLIPIEKLVPWLKKRDWTLPSLLARQLQGSPEAIKMQFWISNRCGALPAPACRSSPGREVFRSFATRRPVGAIGVSGSATVQEDEQCAKAGAEALDQSS
jgi:hypothetical protein